MFIYCERYQYFVICMMHVDGSLYNNQSCRLKGSSEGRAKSSCGVCGNPTHQRPTCPLFISQGFRIHSKNLQSVREYFKVRRDKEEEKRVLQWRAKLVILNFNPTLIYYSLAGCKPMERIREGDHSCYTSKGKVCSHYKCLPL